MILVSEDEDEHLITALCDEMEKENTPKQSILEKSRSLFLKLESELRNEETTLLLLQQLRANQRSHSLHSKSSKVPNNSQPTTRSTQSPVIQSKLLCFVLKSPGRPSNTTQTQGRSNVSGTPNRTTHCKFKLMS